MKSPRSVVNYSMTLQYFFKLIYAYYYLVFYKAIKEKSPTKIESDLLLRRIKKLIVFQLTMTLIPNLKSLYFFLEPLS